ncbi:MAG: SDR family oxidoreductase [Mangrovibacterium sp.]
MMQTISILGVGWLGLPLARKLISSGYTVKGSVTSAEKKELLQQVAICPFRLVLNKESLLVDNSSFFDADVLIVSVPPRRISDIEAVFPAQISHLICRLEQTNIKKVIFISSTSVYPESEGIARETDLTLPDKASGRALLMAENQFRRNENFETTVIRFGGLIGADRNPARFLTRKQEVVVGAKPVNLIHLDDCIQIILEIIRQGAWGETFNACCPEHPTREEFYQKAADVSGIPAPQFSHGFEPYKIVDSSKLIRFLDYRFKYPSPMDYLAVEF